MNDKPCAKKPRTIYTPQQICYLEEQFTKEEFPNKGKRKVIADYLNISEHHVQIWFQNKRAKQKRKEKKRVYNEKRVHVPQPPSFWPQNLSFNSSLQVKIDDHEDTASLTTSITSASSDSEKLSVIVSPTSSLSASVSLSKGATVTYVDETDHSEPSAQVDSHYYPMRTQRKVESFSTCLERDVVNVHGQKGHHSTKSALLMNGSSSNSMERDCFSYSNEDLPKQQVSQPERRTNPLLILANCATQQLHKFRAETAMSKSDSRPETRNGIMD